MWLHSGAKDNIYVRSAYLHMIGDAISAFGVVIAGLIMVFTAWPLADPLVSFLIAALILWSSWGTLRESVSVLLEGSVRFANHIAGVAGQQTQTLLSVGEKLGVLIGILRSRRRSSGRDRHNAGRVRHHGGSLRFPVRCISDNRLGNADQI